MTFRILCTEQGISVVEVMVVSVVLMALLTSVGLSMLKLMDWKNGTETQNDLENLVKAFRVHYLRNIDITFAKINGEYNTIKGSLGTWNGSGSVFNRMVLQSFYCGRSLTPVVKGLTSDSYSTARGYTGYGTAITVYDISPAEKRTLSFGEDLPIVQYFLEAGCEVTAKRTLNNTSYNYIGHVQEYDLTCRDGWGRPLRFYTKTYTDRPSVSSYSSCSIVSSGTLVSDFNPRRPIRYEVRSAGRDRVFHTSDDRYVRWDTSGLDGEIMSKSLERLRKVADVLEGVHQKITVLEYERSSSISLQGYDDVRVPWVWRVYSVRGKSPSTLFTDLCNVSNVPSCRPTLSCVCENTGWWYTGGSSEASITAVVFFNLLRNNLIDVEDMYDAFGMPLVIDLLGAAGGSWYPPKPSDNYSLSPPYVSTVKTTWGEELRVSHGQP